MPPSLTLASASAARAGMLRNAGVEVVIRPARIDEDAVRAALVAEDAAPRDMADTLAEMKARQISQKDPAALVLGADQILVCGGNVLAKADTLSKLRDQLQALRGREHVLLSAAVICENGAPVWRHLSEARLTMHDFSDAYLDGYLARNWPAVGSSVGGYQVEGEGVRLMSRIDGDHFTILGLPLLPLLGYLTIRGILAG